MQKYQPLSQLGDGTFGVVIKAQVKATGEFVAIKKMKQPYPIWDECLKLSEVVVLKKLKHSPHVIRLREVFREGHTLYFVFDCMDGDLLAVITGKSQVSGSNIITAAGGGGVSLPKVKNYLFQILQGVAHIHKSGFFHRDMKPENILFQRSSPAGSNDADSQEILKIADFGLVKEIRGNPIGTEYVSTRWYRAPELLLQERRYSSPIDVFAVACIGFEMVSGFPLFPGKSENDQLFKVFSVLGTPSPSNWPEAIPKMKQLRFSMPPTSGKELPSICPKLAAAPQLVDLLSKMLELNPNRRISASSALQHPFFASSVYGVSEEIVTFKQQQQQQTASSIAINGSNNQKFPPPPPSIILANNTTTSTTKAATSNNSIKNVISFPPSNFESNHNSNNNNTVVVVASKEPTLPPAPTTISSNIATAPLQQYQDRKLPSFAPLGTTNSQQPLQNASNNTHNHSLLSFNQNSNNNNINSVNVVANNNTNAATVPSSSSFSKLHALGHNSANPNAPIILNNNQNNNTTKSTKSSSSFKDKLPTPASMLKPLPAFSDKPLASADNQHNHNHPASGLSAMEALRRASEVDALLEKLSKFDAVTKGGSSINSKAATKSKLTTNKVPATVIPPLMELQVETTSKSRTNSAAAGKEKHAASGTRRSSGSKKSSETNKNNNNLLDDGTDDTVIIIGVEAENDNNNNGVVKPLIPELLLEKKTKTKSKKVFVTEATAFNQEEVSNPNDNNQGVADEVPQYDASPSSLLLLRHPEQVQKESPLAKLLGSARYGPSFTQRGRLRPSKSKSQESQHQVQPQQQLPGLNGGFGDGIIIQQQHENADEVIVEKKKTKKKKQVDAASTVNEGCENKNNFLPPL